MPARRAEGTPAPGQLVLDFEPRPSLSAADFIVASGNELAFEHLSRWPDWPVALALVEGGPKSGKSHLGRIWAERSGALAPGPAGLEAVVAAAVPRPVLLEDVDREPYGEAAVFHLLNQSIREGRPVLMTARTPIEAWPYATADLSSRARLATRLVLADLDDTQLSQMFVKLFGDRQVTVEPHTIGYLVTRIERSPEEVVELVALMDRLALSRGRPITRAIAAEAVALREAARGAEDE